MVKSEARRAVRQGGSEGEARDYLGLLRQHEASTCGGETDIELSVLQSLGGGHCPSAVLRRCGIARNCGFLHVDSRSTNRLASHLAPLLCCSQLSIRLLRSPALSIKVHLAVPRYVSPST